MQLSDAQIQYLFQFTEKKSVRWYDLQIELVDHLASRIEEEMDADKEIGFETALERVYKDFGLFGFSKIIQAKQAELQRSARKIWWQEVRAFFSWPKIILLALIVAVLWTLSQLLPPNFLMAGFLAAYIIASLGLLKNVFRYKKARRKLLLLQFGSTYISSTIFFYEILVFCIIDNVSALTFCIYATIGIVFLAASFQLYQKVKEKAVNLYPAAFA
jgi:hypothetical protein